MHQNGGIGRGHILVASGIALVLASAMGALLSHRSEYGRDSVAALEATIERYRIAGYFAPPEGLAASVPPHVFVPDGTDALGELYLWNCLQRVNQISHRRL